MEKIEVAISKILESIFDEIPSVLMALISLLVGIWVIRLIIRFLRGSFERRDVDLSLRDFVISIVKFILYTMLLISTASKVGIQTTSFVAVLGAASLSIGLALQGSLSNFAGGVLILIFKPFRVGHYINSTNGASGTVEKIDILYTTLMTSEGIEVFCPNGPLANSVISNYSAISKRRVEYKIGITYKSDISLARDTIIPILSEDKRVLKQPAPEVLLGELSDKSVTILVRYWTLKAPYWEAYHDNFEKIKKQLQKAGIDLDIIVKNT